MVDVEIYMNNIIKFFRENPTDLLNLVPKDKEEYFYTKIKKVAIENYEKGEDVSLTQSQLIDVCSEINQPDKPVPAVTPVISPGLGRIHFNPVDSAESTLKT